MKLNNKGSAIGLVLIFLTAMLLIGTALLVMSEFNFRGAAAGTLMDRSYYAAESAAQLAAQEFKTGYGALPALAAGYIPPGSSLSAFMTRFEADARDHLAAVYGSLAGRYSFNNETASLGDPVFDLVVGGDAYDVMNEADEAAVYAAAWIETLTVTIPARAGGRTVSAAFGMKGGAVTGMTAEGTVTVPGDNAAGVISDGSGWTEAFDEYNGSSLGNSPPVNPGSLPGEVFFDALRTLLNDGENIARNAIPDVVPERTASAGNLTLAGPLTLDAEYLHVAGSLTVNGTVNMPNLKGCYIEGDLIISNGARLTCNSYRKRLAADPDEGPFTGPLAGTCFIVGDPGTPARMTVGSGCTLTNARFYVPELITVNVSAGIRGNCVYMAYGPNGTVTMTNGASNQPLGSVDAAPQFYATRAITYFLRGNGDAARLYGIYATLGDLINAGTSSNNPTYGFLMGNTLSENVNKGVNTETLTESQKNSMIDIGSLFSVINPPKVIGVIRPGIPVYSSVPVILGIRETTGE